MSRAYAFWEPGCLVFIRWQSFLDKPETSYLSNPIACHFPQGSLLTSHIEQLAIPQTKPCWCGFAFLCSLPSWSNPTYPSMWALASTSAGILCWWHVCHRGSGMSIHHVLISSLHFSHMDCDFGTLSVLLLYWARQFRREGLGHVHGCIPIMVQAQ